MSLTTVSKATYFNIPITAEIVEVNSILTFLPNLNRIDSTSHRLNQRLPNYNGTSDGTQLVNIYIYLISLDYYLNTYQNWSQ